MDFLPRQLAYRGSRLVYSRGIVALALIASGLIILFQASVTKFNSSCMRLVYSCLLRFHKVVWLFAGGNQAT